MAERRRADRKADPGNLVALAALLVGVRELAARASAQGLPLPLPAPAMAPPPPAPAPAPAKSGWFARWFGRSADAAPSPPPAPPPAPPPFDPFEQRRALFHEGVRSRLQALAALRGVPAPAREILAWLADPQAFALAASLPVDAQSAPPLPAGLRAADWSCVLRGWSHVNDRPLAEAISDVRIVAGDALVEAGLCPILSQVNGGEGPRPPETIAQDLRLRLAPLSADAVMPVDATDPRRARDSYPALWDAFLQDARALPARDDLGRAWLDAFDSLLAIALHAVAADPFEACPMDSLLDVTRLSAACAVCLLAHDRVPVAEGARATDPYRFVVGEFTPIQDFILGADPQGPWPASAVAGGRSAFIKLASELAALSLLERLGLPSVCQVFSAASKFMLLVPHTPKVNEALRHARTAFDDWARSELAGAGGIALGWWMAPALAVCVKRPSRRKGWGRDFDDRYGRALEVLEDAKLRRFRLMEGASAVFPGFLAALDQGAQLCTVDGVSLAGAPPPWLVDALRPRARHAPVSRASACQLALSLQLGEARRLVIHRVDRDHPDPGFTFFGLAVQLVAGPMPRGAGQDRPLRTWDIGYATRAARERRFHGLPVRLVAHHQGEALAQAPTLLKGDVDRLGKVFRHGIPGFSLARMALASRQLDHFFSLRVPGLLRARHPGVQTVLAGGDDFAFIGAPGDILALGRSLQEQWQQYTRNPSLTFSIGIHVGSARMALQEADRLAEEALVLAKRERNSIAVHGRTVEWPRWHELRALEERLGAQLATWSSLEPDAARAGRLRASLLRSLHGVVQRLDDPRGFSGMRWRATVHLAISRFCKALPAQVTQAQRYAAFAGLARSADEGFVRFGPDLHLPLTNLVLAQRAGSVAIGAAPAAQAPQAPPAPAPALAALLARLDWSNPDDTLFGEVADAVAAALVGQGPRRFDGLLQELRDWDLRCDRLDDTFVRLQPQIAASWHRRRDAEGTGSPAADLRRAVLERVHSADELHCARWFVETVTTFHGVRRFLRPPEFATE